MEERAEPAVQPGALFSLQAAAQRCMEWQSLSLDEAVRRVVEALEADELSVPLFFRVPGMATRELPPYESQPYELSREVVVQTLQRERLRRDAGESVPLWGSAWQGIAMRQADAVRLFKDAQRSNPRRPPQQQAWQETAILSKLAEWGINPQATPRAPSGKRCPLKQKLREAFGWTPAQVNKALGRLRADGRVKHG